MSSDSEHFWDLLDRRQADDLARRLLAERVAVDLVPVWRDGVLHQEVIISADDADRVGPEALSRAAQGLDVASGARRDRPQRPQRPGAVPGAPGGRPGRDE